jgi:hypothetical protein
MQGDECLRIGDTYLSERRSSIKLNAAALSPMPSAKVSTAAVANPGFLPKHPESVSKILMEGIEERQAPPDPIDLLRLLDPAKRPPRRIPCFRRTHAPPHILHGGHLDMCTQFLVEFTLQTALGAETTDARGEDTQPRHGGDSFR